jgi:ABC-type dipeptide/oligopeptide/nickel transport system permease subunit
MSKQMPEESLSSVSLPGTGHEEAAPEEAAPSIVPPRALELERDDVTVNDRRYSAWVLGWRAFSRNRLAVVGLVSLVIMILIAIIGPEVYAQSATEANIFNLNPNAWPSAAHPLGTDNNGIDILARLMVGMRVSLGVAFFVEALNVLFGVPVGLIAGYFTGAIDFVLSRIADVLFAFPGLLLAILVAGVFGPSVGDLAGGLGRLALVTAALALVSWPLMARYVRAEVLSLREREYVEAARAIGAPISRIMLIHITPNVMGLVLTAATLDMASVVVNEATLSLLGLGVQPPHASIGLMISSAIQVLNINWTESLFPGLVLTAMVLSFSFVGDGLRDALDPRALR